VGARGGGESFSRAGTKKAHLPNVQTRWCRSETGMVASNDWETHLRVELHQRHLLLRRALRCTHITVAFQQNLFDWRPRHETLLAPPLQLAL
jgi:hypothetical protein